MMENYKLICTTKTSGCGHFKTYIGKWCEGCPRLKVKFLDEQPTIVEIDQAFTEALQCDGDIVNSVATKQRLAELREKRTTWIGKGENLLRCKIDEFGIK